MTDQQISDTVVRRLPTYYRHLRELEKEGVRQISSKELGLRMGQKASLVRQDISGLGEFGRQGFGYDVSLLKQGIGRILGLTHRHRMIILGAGSIGSAVARYPNFAHEGFETLSLFDIDEARVGAMVGPLRIEPMANLERFCRENAIDIAVLAVPPDAAQACAEKVSRLGIRAIWNFAPVDLRLETGITVVNVHLSDSLQVLSYRMEQAAMGEETKA